MENRGNVGQREAVGVGGEGKDTELMMLPWNFIVMFWRG